MTNKIRCPRCASKLTKKIINKYNYYSSDYKLTCKVCDKKNNYCGFRSFHKSNDDCYEIICYHFIGSYRFSIRVNKSITTIYHPKYSSKISYPVSIFLEKKENYSVSFKKIGEYDGYDLIDQNVDVFDFDSLFLFFRKECIRWHKLKAFL